MKTQFFATVLIAAVGFGTSLSYAGENVSGEVGYVPTVSASSSGVTRSAVHDEVLQAQRNDTLLSTGEGADIGAVASARSDVTRAGVRAEAVYAVRHGLTAGGEV